MAELTTRFAPEGAIWVCAACGKTHKDQYGIEGEGSRGWDVSCALNAVLCHADRKFDGNGLLVWWPFEDNLSRSAKEGQ